MWNKKKDLEKAVEFLLDYFKEDVTSEMFIISKQFVLNQYKFCENRQKVLLQYVHEGYEKEWWEFSEWKCFFIRSGVAEATLKYS